VVILVASFIIGAAGLFAVIAACEHNTTLAVL
jgi:hypothetical protein